MGYAMIRVWQTFAKTLGELANLQDAYLERNAAEVCQLSDCLPHQG